MQRGLDDITISSAYFLAQHAIADLKTAVLQTVTSGPKSGLTNAELGRSLGIYMGHVRHEGHISRTILNILQGEGVIEQNSKTKRWKLKSHGPSKK